MYAIRNGDTELRTVTVMMPIFGTMMPILLALRIHPNDWIKIVGAYNGILCLSYYDIRKSFEEMGALLRLYIPFSLLAFAVLALAVISGR